MDSIFEPVSIRGRYFWRGHNRFVVRGVVYQDHNSAQPIDPITDDRLPDLERDVLLFRELGVNTILVYRIDTSKDHTEVMRRLAEAGIYVLVNVGTPHSAVNRLAPYESYEPENLHSFFRTVDTMAQYPNTLGVFAGYTTVNDHGTENAAPVIAAVVRDLKKYIQIRHDATGQRILPVGYGASSTDDRDRALLQYLSAGEKNGCIDFWTCTAFSLLDESGMEDLGLGGLVDRYQDANLPMFFSEYGYGQRPRYFNGTTTLYSSRMINVFSGGCVYEFWQGGNNYGLVKLQTSRDGAAAERDRELPHAIRQTDQGTLLVFDEFEHYKAKLRSTRDAVLDPPSLPLSERNAIDVPVDVQSRFESRGKIPVTCIDWAQLGETSLNETV